MSNRTRDTQVETDQFSREISGLPKAHPSETVELGDGEQLDIEIAPVAKRLGDVTVRMLAYNGSIPGPTLKVRQDSEVLVNVTNLGDLEATVHWHGVRVENRYDGTHQTQAPIEVGESFTYHVQFPDPGVYWYHPHIREDYGQELGLYGNIIVVPAEPEYWPPANRELPLTLDDVLLDEEGKVAPFSHHETTYVAMGRFGDVLLIGGESDLALRARLGEVMRFHFTNTANTRVFKVGLPGARMKLVGGDSGRHEHEEFVDDVLLAPSERVVVDVLFEEAGELTLEHRTPERVYALASITVDEEPAEPSFAEEFEVLRANPELVAERERIAPYIAAPPDKILALVAEMDLGGPEVETGAVYACPMHSEIVASWAGKCPKCGMKLVPAEAGIEVPTACACPMHPGVTATWAGTCPKCGMTLRATGVGQAAEGVADAMTHEKAGHGESHEHGGSEGIEWEDDMVDVNRMTTPANMRWLLVDRETGAENAAIDWQFRVGDRVKIRIINEMDSDHPMHHPIHIHGAGRFLILSRDDVVEPNLVWKDTVLVRTGETVDILLDVTNPGVWMMHCHIAEHHESGMMFSFNVAPEAGHSVESR